MAVFLGDINFGLGVDTARLDAAVQQVNAFGQVVDRAAQSQVAGARQVEAALRRQEAAMVSAIQKVQQLNDGLRRSGAGDAAFQQTTNALNTLVNELGVGRVNALQFQRSMEDFRQSTSLTTREITAAGRAAAGHAGNLRQLADVAVLVQGPMSGLATRVSLMTRLFDQANVSAVAFVGGLALGIAAFAGLGDAAVKSAIQLQKLDQMLTAVTGSHAIAAAEIEYVHEVALKTGVAFVQLAEQYAQLTAASKGTVLEGQHTRDIFEAIVFSGAKLHLSSQQVERTLYAVQQMMSKGRVTAQELRQQLGNDLPGAMAIMADALGKSTQEIDKLMKKGELGSDVLVKFGEAMKQRFGVDTNIAINTIQASQGRLSTAFFDFGVAVDRVLGFSTAYQKTLEAMARGLEYLGTNFKSLIVIIGTAAAAFAGFYSPIVLRGFTLLYEAILAVGAATRAWTIALLANPIGAIGGILVRVAIAVGTAVAAYVGFNAILGDSTKSLNEQMSSVDEYIKAQENLKTSITATTDAYVEQVKAAMILTQTQLEAAKQAAAAVVAHPHWSAQGIGGAVVGRDDVVTKEQEEVNRLQKVLKDYQDKLDQLNQIREKQVEKNKEIDARGNVTIMSDRAIQSVEDAKNKIKELQETLDSLNEAQDLRKESDMWVDINKKVDAFKTSLEKAGVPAERLNELVKQFTETLTSVETQKFTNDLQQAFDKVNKSIEDANEKLKILEMSPGQRRLAQSQADIEAKVRDTIDALLKEGASFDEATAAGNRLRQALTGLDTAQTAERMRLPLKNAVDTIKELQLQYQALLSDPNQRAWLEIQQDINKQVENYRDRLIQAEVPATQVAALTQKFAEALTQVKQQQYAMQQFPTVFNTIAESLGKGMDDAMGKFVDDITQGKDVLQDLANVARQVVADIIKSFLQLALINPLKNWLFGGDVSTGKPFPTLGSWSSGSGLLGGLLGGGQKSAASVQPQINAASVASNALTTGVSSSIQSTIANYSQAAAQAAIKSIESAGSGGYLAKGPIVPGTIDDRGLGAYQVMNYNVGPWTKKWLGQSMTPSEFLHNPGAQDQVFNGQFGEYVQKYGVAGAGQAWLGGPGSVGKLNRTDFTGTSVGGYSNTFMQRYQQAIGKSTDSLKDFDSAASRTVQDTTKLGSSFTDLSKTATDGAGSLNTAAQEISHSGGGLATATQGVGTQAQSMFGGLGDIFNNIISGIGNVAKGFLGAFGSVFQSIISGLSNIGGGGGGGLFSWLGSLFGAANGAAFIPGGQRFAGGGTFQSPTIFPTSSGPVLGGEAGPEAIMPLARGSDGKLGIKADTSGSDGSSDGHYIFESHVHFHGEGPRNTEEQKRLSKQLKDQTRDMFNAMLIESKRRGGILNPRTS